MDAIMMKMVNDSDTRTAKGMAREIHCEAYIMRFGKYKGETLNALTPSYLNFLLKSDWFNEIEKETLRNHIVQEKLNLELSFGKYKNMMTSEITDESYIHFLTKNKIVDISFFTN